MTDLDQHTDDEIFYEYEKRVHNIAMEIADDMNALGQREVLQGREWCDERDIPESVFADAVNWYISGVNWGVSPMYPFKSKGDVIVDPFQTVDEYESSSEDELEQETKELVEKMEEADNEQ